MNKTLLALATFLIPTAAFAHNGVDHPSGFAAGFAHPFSGMDHILAMVMVGLMAISIGGRALWLVPTAFVGMMIVGGAGGIGAIALPGVETGIALSVVAFGIVLASGWKLSTAFATAIAGVFALFHGHAHGTEMMAGSNALGYVVGFIGATCILHLSGIGLGFGAAYMHAFYRKPVLRIFGGICAGLGLGMLTGLV